MGTLLRAGTGALAATCLLAVGAGAQEYHVDLDRERQVTFVSSTQLDEFEGVTDRIDGFVLLDGQGVRAAESIADSEIYFEVDLASLETGIRLRDRHMRDNYLEVGDHPYATFAGSVTRMEADGEGYRILAQGSFSVHGVSRPRALECGASPEGDGFAVSCGFPVSLEDHGIRIPRVMFLKLAPVVEMELAFHLKYVSQNPGAQS